MAEDLYTPHSIRTVSGRYVNLVRLDPETIHIADLAHALCHTPRFAGHLPVFYSVAQHSIDVVRLVPGHLKLQALLHDASEAYLCDVPSPLKAHLPEYVRIENRMMEVIAGKYGFRWPLDPVVKEADRRCLVNEWERIMLPPRHEYAYSEAIPLRPAPRREVYHTFLELFNDLYTEHHGQPHADMASTPPAP